MKILDSINHLVTVDGFSIELVYNIVAEPLNDGRVRLHVVVDVYASVEQKGPLVPLKVGGKHIRNRGYKPSWYLEAPIEPVGYEELPCEPYYACGGTYDAVGYQFALGPNRIQEHGQACARERCTSPALSAIYEVGELPAAVAGLYDMIRKGIAWREKELGDRIAAYHERNAQSAREKQERADNVKKASDAIQSLEDLICKLKSH